MNEVKRPPKPSTSTNQKDPIRFALVKLIDERIAAAMAARGAVDTYSSSGPLPPDAPSRRAFVEACRRIPDAAKVGRTWTVSREAWHQARRSRPRPAALRLVEKPDEMRVDEMIRAAGFRLTGGSR